MLVKNAIVVIINYTNVNSVLFNIMVNYNYFYVYKIWAE